MRVVVVGGDGTIGRGLSALVPDNPPPLITTRKLPSGERRGDYYGLNLSDLVQRPYLAETFADACNNGVEKVVVYLSAAVTEIKHCETDPVGTAIINVHGTVYLARSLLRRGARVVFLSSSAVFSGECALPIETAPCDPITEYGRQKKETEDTLLGLAKEVNVAGSVAIVRLTKVIGCRTQMIAEWLRHLRLGNPIEAASDLHIAPISTGNALQGLIRIGFDGNAGVFHLSGQNDLSWYEFALLIASALGRPSEDVVPVQLAFLNQQLHLPRFSALSMLSTSARTRLMPQRAKDVVGELIHESLRS